MTAPCAGVGRAKRLLGGRGGDRAGAAEGRHRHRATWLLRLPTKVLTALAGGGIDDLVADELTVLRAADGEVLLHPTDLLIRGPEPWVARVRAVLSQHLAFSTASLTWTKEANTLEDQLRALG